MNIKDLKKGSKVYIRSGLIKNEKYNNATYVEGMGYGEKTIDYLFSSSENFTVKDGCFCYSSEMIDWKKTMRLNNIKNSNRMENINTTDLAKEYLNSKFGYLNINKDVVNENIFKEITQYGDYKKEVTKGVTYDGEEIVVKNEGEENDVEKAVMLLMLKSLGFTYGDVKKEVKKVKVKWAPAMGEQFYYVSTTPTLKARALTYFIEGALKETIDSGNCFRTKEEAEEKLEKIKEVLRGDYDGK